MMKKKFRQTKVGTKTKKNAKISSEIKAFSQTVVVCIRIKCFLSAVFNGKCKKRVIKNSKTVFH